MFNFFASENSRQGDLYYIEGADYNHIKNVLRFKEGDTLLVSENGKSHLCALERFEGAAAVLKIIEENYQSTELNVKLYLFQGLPKSDKMELIIQKAVELGAYAVVPVEMNRCVVKLDPKKKASKTSRWQALSESAAKQSKRNVVPQVMEVMSFKEATKFASSLDLFLLPYESKNGMQDTLSSLKQIKGGSSVGIMIGPEGGFEPFEAEAAEKSGAHLISLGKRILRTETAAITALSMCMLYCEMNCEEEK